MQPSLIELICYYNHMTRNGSLHEIFTTMSETLVNFIKFSRRQIEVDSQYQVQHWPYTNYTYCSYTLTTLTVAMDHGVSSEYCLLPTSSGSWWLHCPLPTIDNDSLNPVVHFNRKSMFQRKTITTLTLKKVKSCQENVNIFIAQLL